MKTRVPSLILLAIILAVIIPSRSSPLPKGPFEHSLADSILMVQFGIDSTMVDSLLIHKLETTRFLFRFSANLRNPNELRSKASSYDAFCDTVSRILQLAKSSFKTNVYLYADTLEQSLCFKGWPPLRENQAVSLLREIHANGLGAIKHEIVHVLFNDLVAHARSAFFAEGVEQYVEQVRSDDVFRQALRIAKKFLSHPWEKWANDSIGFWATGEDESIIVAYPVSGLFVKYLIQRSGVETFKEFYRRIRTEVSTEVAFSIVYGYPLSKAISEFKTTIASW
jgi:hypothetical protein